MTQALTKNPVVRRRVAQVTFSAYGKQSSQYTIQSRGFSSTTPRRPRRMFRLGVGLAKLANFIKIDLRPYQPETFHTKSVLGKHVWHSQSNKPLEGLEEFGRAAQVEPESIVEFLKAAIAEANKLTDRNGLVEYVETQFGHQYVYVSSGVPTPESMLSKLTNLKDPMPFIDMHTCFPPYGTLIPRGLTDGSEIRDREAVVSHVRKFLDSGAGPVGLGALGDSSTIEFSGYTASQLQDYFARYVWANTTGKHVFDGRVLWIQVIDPATKQMYFIGIGAGKHSLDIMDGINTVMGAVVFTIMIRRYGHALRLQSTSSEPPVFADGLGWESPGRAAVLEKVERDEPDLVTTEAIVSMLDFFGQLASWLRNEVGTDVVGPPKSGAMIEFESDLGDDTGEKD
jgi:hypothetical protein